MKLLVL